MYEAMAKSHPSLERGKVWCRTCRREQSVDSAECLQNGWPKCCGYTMTIDPPSTWDQPSSETEKAKKNVKQFVEDFDKATSRR